MGVWQELYDYRQGDGVDNKQRKQIRYEMISKRKGKAGIGKKKKSGNHPEVDKVERAIMVGEELLRGDGPDPPTTMETGRLEPLSPVRAKRPVEARLMVDGLVVADGASPPIIGYDPRAGDEADELDAEEGVEVMNADKGRSRLSLLLGLSSIERRCPRVGRTRCSCSLPLSEVIVGDDDDMAGELAAETEDIVELYESAEKRTGVFVDPDAVVDALLERMVCFLTGTAALSLFLLPLLLLFL